MVPTPGGKSGMNGNTQIWKALGSTFGGVMLVWAGWMTNHLLEHEDNIEKRLLQIEVTLATIKANRFTSKDGMEVWREISDIKEQMATEEWVEGRYPPSWLIQRLSNVERQVGIGPATIPTPNK